MHRFYLPNLEQPVLSPKETHHALHVLRLKVGDTLNVARKGKDITDPATGKVLRSITSPVGTMVITQVDENSATGKFSGSGTPQVKDIVTNK